MRRIIPTAAGVENVLKLLGHKWHGEWQRRAMQHMMKHRKSVNQFMRQAGKGFTLAECCAAGLLGGLILTFTMPTLTQSQRIMFRAVSNNMVRLESLFGSNLKRTRNTESEVLWNNGAALRALSSNEASEKEGYTSDWVIIDEAHKAPTSLMAIVQPFTNQAQMEGRDKIILNGVGGHPSSTIEAMKDRGFAPLRITPEEIIADNPKYKQVVDEARQTLSPDEYRQYYDCLPVSEGHRYIFPIMNKAIELPSYGLSSDFFFGIDVGRTSDCTVVSVLEACGENVNLVEEMRITGANFLDQGDRIYNFIDKFSYRPDNIAIEVNGLGIGLYDILSDRIPGIKPVHMNYILKYSTISYLQRLMRKKNLGVSVDRVYRELSELTYEVNDNYKYFYAHSDSLSGVIIAVCAMQKAGVMV